MLNQVRFIYPHSKDPTPYLMSRVLVYHRR